MNDWKQQQIKQIIEYFKLDQKETKQKTEEDNERATKTKMPTMR